MTPFESIAVGTGRDLAHDAIASFESRLAALAVKFSDAEQQHFTATARRAFAGVINERFSQ